MRLFNVAVLRVVKAAVLSRGRGPRGIDPGYAPEARYPTDWPWPGLRDASSEVLRDHVVAPTHRLPPGGDNWEILEPPSGYQYSPASMTGYSFRGLMVAVAPDGTIWMRVARWTYVQLERLPDRAGVEEEAARLTAWFDLVDSRARQEGCPPHVAERLLREEGKMPPPLAGTW